MQTSVAAWLNVDKTTLEVYNEQFRINVKSSREGFLGKFGLPKIIGTIDCTHFKILSYAL